MITLNKLKRLGVIDYCISTQGKRDKVSIILEIEKKLGEKISESVLQKDIQILRREFDAPIAYSFSSLYYYYVDYYNFALEVKIKLRDFIPGL